MDFLIWYVLFSWHCLLNLTFLNLNHISHFHIRSCQINKVIYRNYILQKYNCNWNGSQRHENTLIKKVNHQLATWVSMFRNAYGGWTTWARNFKKGFCIWMSAKRMEVYLETFISLNGPYKMRTKNRRMNKEEKTKQNTVYRGCHSPKTTHSSGRIKPIDWVATQ